MALIGIDNNYSVNMDQLDLGVLTTGVAVTATSSLYAVAIGSETTFFSGSGFTYNSLGIPTGGSVTEIQDQYQGHGQD